MAKPILVANWKNHPNSLSEAKTILGQLSRNRLIYKKVSLFIAPPQPYFEIVSLRTKGFARLVSQDMPDFYQGTYTGTVTLDILKSFGVRAAIIGHSESRARGETNEMVSQKTKIALRAGIIPIVCVGESSRDDEGEHFEFLREQLKFSLACLKRKSDLSRLILAYEPVWAIGKRAKSAIGPDDLSETVIFLRKILTDMFGRVAADRVNILYGGSVEPGNASALMKGADIKGFLVGRASLNSKDFLDIAKSLTAK